MTATISPAELENCKRAFSITDKEGMLPFETLYVQEQRLEAEEYSIVQELDS